MASVGTSGRETASIRMSIESFCPHEGFGTRIFRSVAAQCTLGAFIAKSPRLRIYKVPPLHDLPEALAILVLSFLTAKNICKSVRLVDQLWRTLSHDNGLWKTLCEVMEKTPAMPEKPLFPWEVIYMGNPHVPGDYSSITRAAKFARSWHGGRVFIAEGEYSEALVINDDARIQATESAMNKATIKLVTSKVDTPTVDIKSGDVRFTGINFEHDCQGQDIWNGNSAVMIHGPAEVNFANCAISSKSGRGVVAIRGARLMMSDSIVSNSAATGIYVGGDGTTGEISGCTVTDCGRGGHRVLRGHSGVFIDRAKFDVKKSLLYKNHLTGLSLVGDAASSTIEGTIIKENATLAIDAPPDKIIFKGENTITSEPIADGPVVMSM